jgi:hypothetical protein
MRLMTLDEQHSIAVDRHGETPQQVCSVHRQCFCDGAMPDHHERQVLVVLHGCKGSTPTWVDKKNTSCSPLLLVHPPLLSTHRPRCHAKEQPSTIPLHSRPTPHLEEKLVRITQQLPNCDLAEPRARPQEVPHTAGQRILIHAYICCCCCTAAGCTPVSLC